MIRTLPLLLLLQVFLVTSIYAQPNPQAKNGRVTGKVTDASTQKPVEFASVMLLRPADSSIASGALTSENGQFVLENVAYGKYILKVQSISYDVFLLPNVSLSAENPSGYYPKIAIKPSATEMKEVVIEGEKRLIQTSIDRKIFNVDQIATTQGGSATDVLQQVPSVSVDNDGNITLRGSGNVTIFIDGKPSTLSGSLENIPASSIEKVELLTNPSAKYDPQGMAGIINIVLKKERKPGYNGNITANVGTGNKANASTSINYNYGKANVSAMYSFRYNDVWRDGSGYRKQFLGNDIYGLEQMSRSENLSNTHMIRLGLDYTINARNSFGISGSYNNNLRRDWENITYNEWVENGLTYKPYYRKNSLRDTDDNWDASVNYLHKFLKEGREFSLLGSVSSEAETEDMLSEWQNMSGRLANDNFYALQNIINGQNNLISVLQADYITPLKNNRKFETGYKTTLRSLDNDLTGLQYDTTNFSWADKNNLSNRFKYNEQVHAAYVNYAGTYKKWGYQTGLRGEQTIINTHQFVNNVNDDQSYFNLFPSAFLTYKIKESREIQLSYSRRINRPWLGALNPFPDYADPLNLRTGNPDLKPENIDAYELGYVAYSKKMTFTSSVYLRNTFNMMTRVRSIDSSGVSTTTFANINSSANYGLELIANNNWFPWLTTTASANLFRTELSGNIGQSEVENSNFTYMAKLNANIKLPKKIDFQLSGHYHGPTIFPQGEMKPMYAADAALKAPVLKGKGTISVSLNDIFNTRRFAFYSAGPGFAQDFTFKRETRILFVGFTYRFGNAKPMQNKQPRRQMNENNGDGDMGF